MVLLNGDIPDDALARKAASGCRAVVCADGGVRHAARLGLSARFVVGDMDSLPSPLPDWKETTYVCDFDEDRSDLEKTLSFCEQLGASELWVAGALGGRLDHALVNLRVLERPARWSSLTLIDRGLARLSGPGRHALKCRRGQTVSLIACPEGALASSSGLRYPLRKTRLRPGSLGLSNRALRADVELRIHRGRAWIALCR